MSTNFWKQKVCWHHPAMFCLITPNKFSLKVMGLNSDFLNLSSFNNQWIHSSRRLRKQISLFYFEPVIFCYIFLTFSEWHTLGKATWYTYGTLLGEAITRDTKSGKSRALRIAIATWILYCLVISQGYGGSLKAYLSTPAFSNPIDSLQQVSSNFWIRAL